MFFVPISCQDGGVLCFLAVTATGTLKSGPVGADSRTEGQRWFLSWCDLWSTVSHSGRLTIDLIAMD